MKRLSNKNWRGEDKINYQSKLLIVLDVPSANNHLKTDR